MVFSFPRCLFKVFETFSGVCKGVLVDMTLFDLLSEGHSGFCSVYIKSLGRFRVTPSRPFLDNWYVDYYLFRTILSPGVQLTSL